MSGWEQIVEVIDRVPSGVWMGLAAGNVALSIITWSFARRRLRRAGQRIAALAPDVEGDTAKDTALTVAAMIPAGLFWGMVLAGSFHGLVAFGSEVLGWHRGWEFLVPATLDGVSVTFAFLAFRAVRLRKSPLRCQRVVWGAALASATVNFAYEYIHSNHNVVAGGYLGLLSLFGMVMFHEFLDQFEEGTGYVKRAVPSFGLRWITWPTNTFCAAVAWRNHPPAPGTPATVLRAVANLERVRELKRAAREAAVQVRHERAIVAAHRRAELAAARSAAEEAPAEPAPVDAVTPPSPVSGGEGPATVAADGGNGATTGKLRLPTTAATAAQWADTWVRMCADGDQVLGTPNDEQARARYNLSARQLRNIRNAATSGALRRRAQELGIGLPAAYTDMPAPRRVNGHALAAASR
jgi:hypothetical protein